MSENSKRKSVDVGSPLTDGRVSKRQKLSEENDATNDSAQHVREIGLQFVEIIRQVRDKAGRSVADAFLTLPSKAEYPDYYEQVVLPIAIDTIENKLEQGEYKNLSEVEGDAKRMVQNAKHFNDRKSLIFADAERIRKTTSNFMVKHNPAYKDKLYTAQPTPLPTDRKELSNPNTQNLQESQSDTQQQQDEDGEEDDEALSTKKSPNGPQNDQVVQADLSDTKANVSLDFTGKDMQQAQEMILSELIKYEEDGIVIYTPFVNLPARSLTDYYAVIKQPLSLKGAQKRVRGVQGRAPPTGISDYKSWEAFEQNVSLIWRNAREYNEDGSEMYILATDLEKHFTKLLQEAKEKIPNPSQPTIKLKMSAPPKPSIKLRLGGQRDSPSSAVEPAAKSPATSGVIIDNKALERQQQHVKASMNGRPASSNGQVRRSGSPNARVDHEPATQQNIPAASTPATNGVKAEKGSVEPSLPDIQRASTNPPTNSMQSKSPAPPVMPPPNRPESRHASGSPLPHQSARPQSSSSNSNHASYYVPPQNLDNKLRAPGKTAADAILSQVMLSAHSGSKSDERLCFCVPASHSHTQTSKIVTLSSQQSFVKIEPVLSAQTRVRPHRVFVVANGQRLPETGRGRPDMQANAESCFETKLGAGVTRIDVEAVAMAASKAGVKGTGEQLEIEKITVFAHVLKHW